MVDKLYNIEAGVLYAWATILLAIYSYRFRYLTKADGPLINFICRAGILYSFFPMTIGYDFRSVRGILDVQTVMLVISFLNTIGIGISCFLVLTAIQATQNIKTLRAEFQPLHLQRMLFRIVPFVYLILGTARSIFLWFENQNRVNGIYLCVFAGLLVFCVIAPWMSTYYTLIHVLKSHEADKVSTRGLQVAIRRLQIVNWYLIPVAITVSILTGILGATEVNDTDPIVPPNPDKYKVFEGSGSTIWLQLLINTGFVLVVMVSRWSTLCAPKASELERSRSGTTTLSTQDNSSSAIGPQASPRSSSQTGGGGSKISLVVSSSREQLSYHK